MTEEEFRAEMQKRAQKIVQQARATWDTVPAPEGVDPTLHILYSMLGTLACRIAAVELNNERLAHTINEFLSEDPDGSLH